MYNFEYEYGFVACIMEFSTEYSKHFITSRPGLVLTSDKENYLKLEDTGMDRRRDAGKMTIADFTFIWTFISHPLFQAGMVHFW